MVDYNLIKSLGITDEDVQKQLAEALGSDFKQENLGEMIKDTSTYQPGSILTGKVVNLVGNEVIIEVGLKSEGSVDIGEFDDPSEAVPGKPIEVYLESIEGDSGLVVLS